MKVDCDNKGIIIADSIIKNGGVIIFPTDTVYGIGCDPYNETAIKKIYNIKSRDETKQLPVLTRSRTMASTIAHFDEYSEKIAKKFWPGSLTLILQLKDERLKKSLNLDKKIALRVPNNKCALNLLKKCNLLVGTSANVSGQDPFTDPIECYQSMKGFDVLLDGGKISGGVPSTIVEVIDGKVKIKREGNVTKEEIMRLF